ncbi:hypothetical protein [Cupriavidus taiwanensis]|uniref:Lipoprotein n=1 Tax=Cupriavidus taiwanensis TaxID=164546 RepID=A0A375JA25_9BURK|nr:hypothetical protein [Cupriavidus taiwanensis]SPS01729.1 conserved exported hypothetical protein [Cupriavidus taiwanensis]
MNTRSPCQNGQAASRPSAIRHRSRQAMVLLRVLGLCLNSVACAQPEAPQAATAPALQAVTPERKFAPGYLEAAATGYDNGLAWQAEGIAPLRPPREARGLPAAPRAGAVPVAMPAAVRPQPAR